LTGIDDGSGEIVGFDLVFGSVVRAGTDTDVPKLVSRGLAKFEPA
jgi:hypothetical protein